MGRDLLLDARVAIRFRNYAFYTTAIAAAVLLAEDLPHPSNFSAEGELPGKLAARKGKGATPGSLTARDRKEPG